ncbi:epsilon family phenol-soluble modulin [Staphylococcus epidermidis]
MFIINLVKKVISFYQRFIR